MDIVEGRAYVFGSDIDTDQIFPAQYLEITDPHQMALHAMEGCRGDFSGEFERGGIIVAGSNFGCGSSREQAVRVLKYIGTGALIAESYGRIFYRNAINVGLATVRCPGITSFVTEGDIVQVAPTCGYARNLCTGQKQAFEQLPSFLLSIIDSGGLVPFWRQRGFGSERRTRPVR